jgi:hypothetical protein
LPPKTFPYKNKEYTIKQIAEIANITYPEACRRLKNNGWIINADVMKPKKYFLKKYDKIIDVDGEELTLLELAKKYDVDPVLVRLRYNSVKQHRDPRILTAPSYTLP